MNPNVYTPDHFYVHHVPSGQVRRVSAMRMTVDGGRLFQFSTVIKHNGETLYWGSEEDCTF